MLRDLRRGYEIEFNYKEETYSFSCKKYGWYLTRYRDGEDQSFLDVESLIENGKIEEKNISEFWMEVKNAGTA
ncbi:hypothetical protein [Marininema halotolerans]|uniref:Uncharacterized protein n=1 Tax=Marininema halotolerans TaxID=1155944 RepID=A0A1I6UNB8_9BACL|nr:hypothetical protein [Marininema halotolerans]SFT02767.1 hypothetical protein SAMN05444972_11837 [Marininema halotolerans]